MEDNDWRVRSAAIETLAKVGDQKSVDLLLKKLDDPDDIVKKEAIKALGTLGSKDAVSFILPLIHKESLQDEVLSSLEKLGIPDIDYFYSFFKQSNSQLKCRFVDLLGRVCGSSAVDYLIKIIEEEEFFNVRCQAVKALGESGDQKAISTLLKVQKEDSSEEVQKEAGLALKKLEVKK
jgi:HEAT repeat protein